MGFACILYEIIVGGKITIVVYICKHDAGDKDRNFTVAGGDGAGRIISIFYTRRKKSAQRLRLIHDQAANKKLKINDK